MKRILVLASIMAVFFSGCAADLKQRQAKGKAFRQLAEVYMSQNDYTSALQELKKAGEIYYDDPYLHNDLGYVYMQEEKRDLKAAIAHFKKAIDLKPDFIPAKNNLATALLADGQVDAAIATFLEIINSREYALYATPHFPLYNLGMAYIKKKDWKRASEYFKHALEKEPNYFQAWLYLAKTQMEMNRFGEAVKSLETAASLRPNAVGLILDLAKAHEKKGDIAKAISLYQRVIDTAPGSQAARMAEDALQGISP